MGLSRGPAAGGRLILWHGETGTGKTTAIRALMRAWEGWAAAHYIADSEQFFARPDYMLRVLTPSPGAGEGRRSKPHWRLVVGEDADRFLRPDAWTEAGAALARLLTVTDGTPGSGMRMLILITTYEPIAPVHPA